MLWCDLSNYKPTCSSNDIYCVRYFNFRPIQMILSTYMMPHYSDVKTSAMAPQITGVSIVYSTVCSGEDQRKYQSSASLAFVRGHRWVPRKGPVTWKCFHLMTSWCKAVQCNTTLHAAQDYFARIREFLRMVWSRFGYHTWIRRCYISARGLKRTVTWLFCWQLVHVKSKENIKALHYWQFVRWIHQRLVVSNHKRPVMRK